MFEVLLFTYLRYFPWFDCGNILQKGRLDPSGSIDKILIWQYFSYIAEELTKQVCVLSQILKRNQIQRDEKLNFWRFRSWEWRASCHYDLKTHLYNGNMYTGALYFNNKQSKEPGNYSRGRNQKFLQQWAFYLRDPPPLLYSIYRKISSTLCRTDIDKPT